MKFAADSFINNRSLDEIMTAAVKNSMFRSKEEPKKEKLVKRTGNKKARHNKNSKGR